MLLSACGTERVIPQPEIVRVEVTKVIPVPADLTAQRPVTAIPDGVTYGEAAVLWAKDRETVKVLNTQLEGIQSLMVP